MIVRIDTVISCAAALIIPKFIFLIFKWTCDSESYNLVSPSLKNASFGLGMEVGIGVFVILGITFYKLSEYLMYKYYASKIKKEQKEKRLLYDDVLSQIDSYSISKSLQTRLKSEYIIRNY